MVARRTVKEAAENLGIQKGNIVLIHSSFKSLGKVENGAVDVIDGFFDAVGEELWCSLHLLRKILGMHTIRGI